ncbi:FAD-dependent oxidoreductase, partial [Enterococcus faecium]|uniref:FAD-dependent oxidoreductase n=1 Tax=Enterococcus faecium TaxID=1352 RepID=UPI003CC5F526
SASRGLVNSDVKLTDRGAIAVDEYRRTDADNIWAIGDVKGGLQVTYISLDDYRIIMDLLKGENKRTTNNRKAVPYSVFI